MEPREIKIKKILDSQTDKNSQLSMACRKFLEVREKYKNGEGDVIVGLFQLDELADKVYELSHE
jgi:hypothetical protein